MGVGKEGQEEERKQKESKRGNNRISLTSVNVFSLFGVDSLYILVQH